MRQQVISVSLPVGQHVEEEGSRLANTWKKRDPQGPKGRERERERERGRKMSEGSPSFFQRWVT